jgi:rubrerythrin
MELSEMLDRCRDLESRSAALYRSFAAGAHDQPELSALWTDMAREEEEHSHILDEVRARLPTIEAWLTHISGKWPEVVREVGAQLSKAELLTRGADTDQQLAAALELEMTELEPLRQMLVAVSRRRPPRPVAEVHALRLAEGAERFSTDPNVRQRAALLRFRMCPAARDSHA